MEVREEIRLLWAKCGDQFYEENEQELSKLELIDQVPANYPPDLMRPSLGCRAICQRSLKLTDRALHDMEEWQEAVRLQSTKLLTQMLIHCEQTIGPLLFDIIPVLAAKCNDEDRQVTKEALKATKMMGILVAFKNWASHSLESLKKWRNLGNLKCFTALFVASPEEGKWDSLEEILRTIVETEFCLVDDSVFQEHLLFLVEILLEGFVKGAERANGDTIEELFYRITITILSFCGPEEAPLSKAQELLTKLDKVHGKIHEKHLLGVLRGIEYLEDGADESVLLLHGLIVCGGIRAVYLEDLMEAINKVNQSDNSDGKVKLLSGLSIALRQWPETMGEEATVAVMDKFIDRCLLKLIIWRAGTSNEAIRSMATVALYAILNADEENAQQVIGTYVKYLVGLMEDQSVTTRKFSTRICSLIGPMGLENLKAASQGG